jgi:uncharacterized protein (DUF1697 family)
MGDWILSQTPMAITNLAVESSVLVQLALTLNPCSNIVDICLRSENNWRSSLSNVPTLPNFREPEQSSALASRTNKVDINDRAPLKSNIFTANTLRMFKDIFYASLF